MENTAGIQPVMNVGGYGGYGDGFGWGGGGFAWFILLFALMGGNGWGNRGDAARIQDVYASNDNQTLNANVRDLNNSMFRLGNGISDATFALNNTVVNGHNALGRDIANGTYVLDKAITDNRYVIGNAVNEGRFAAQQGFNGVDRNIDAVRYENAMNTGKINETSTCNTQKILDKLGQMELNAAKSEADNLRMQLADARLAVSQCAQNQYLVNTISPQARPAYIVPNPYCNCNGGCGCGVNYGG